MNTLQAATRYLAAGLLPIPIPHGSKKPVIEGWTQLRLTPEDLPRSFSGACNVGILTGAPSAVVVLDVDNHGSVLGEVELRKLEAEHGRLPPTLRARTAGGGWHHYYRWGADRPAVKALVRIAPGLEVRGTGGQVVAPPSIGPSGRPYSWDPAPPLPIADPPAWLAERIAAGATGAPPPTNGADLPADPRTGQDADPIPTGERSSTLTAIAGSLRRRGLSAEAIEGALQATNAQRCRPPMTPAEVRGIARSVARYAPDPDAIPGRPPATSAPSTQAGPPATLTAAALMQTQFPPVEWVVPEVFPRGLTLLVGRPKVGKSYLALSIALAVASGGRALGQIPVERAGVLLLGLEDTPRRLHGRIGEMECGAPDLLHVATRGDGWPRGPAGVESIDTWLREHQDTGLVVIDTLSAFRAARNSRNTDIFAEEYREIFALSNLAERHALGILLLHHSRKAAEGDWIDAAAGTTGVTAAADTIAVLRRGRGQAEAVLQVTGRDVEEQELALRRDLRCGWVVMGSAEQYAISQSRAQVLALLRASTRPLRPGEVAKALGTRTDATKQLMYRMGLDGTLRSDGAGGYELRDGAPPSRDEE